LLNAVKSVKIEKPVV